MAFSDLSPTDTSNNCKYTRCYFPILAHTYMNTHYRKAGNTNTPITINKTYYARPALFMYKNKLYNNTRALFANKVRILLDYIQMIQFTSTQLCIFFWQTNVAALFSKVDLSNVLETIYNM